MDLLCAEICLAGSRDHTVIKYPVTPAEIILLRAMHGEDAVINIELVTSIERSNSEEKERLEGLYKAKTSTDTEMTILEAMFPGYDPRLPVTLKELRLDQSLMNLGPSKLAPWQRPGGRAVEAADPDGEPRRRVRRTRKLDADALLAAAPADAETETPAPDDDDED